MINAELRETLLNFQRNEITEYHIYLRLAQRSPDSANSKVLRDIAEDELRHYHDWQKYTGQEVLPSRFRIWLYFLICRIFGLTFGIKLMERGEEAAQIGYEMLRDSIPEVDAIVRDENDHENALIDLLDEERLRYIGSIVLGLNDALVELTGALAGLTFALQNTSLVALTGLITGIAAALSMGASEYLSTKTEGREKCPIKASVYTGLTYVVTVALLIMPYLLFERLTLCLGSTLVLAVIIIAAFNYYVAVAKDLSFKARFFEMTGLSFVVAAVSFLIGLGLRGFLHVDL